MVDKFDCIIVGGGPAGLSAAIYLGRFNRKVLVIDSAHGRSTFQQVNENYLGFPDGIEALELRELGRRHAENVGARVISSSVTEVRGAIGAFVINTPTERLEARTIILATGVTDILPAFADCQEYFGKSMFWCITCDGCRTREKEVVVLGRTDEAAITCMQMLLYTSSLTLLTDCVGDEVQISQRVRDDLAQHNIPLIEAEITEVEGSGGMIQSVHTSTGQTLHPDFLFTMRGSRPNSQLAQALQVETDAAGYIAVDTEQRTSVAGVYAAGDVTRIHSHQIVTAAHEGSMAAQAANFDLYEPFQRG